MRAKRMQEVAKEWEVLARQGKTKRGGGGIQGYAKCAGGSASTSQSVAARKAATVDQACCRSVGSGIIWLRCAENNSTDSGVDQKRRHGKLDKIKGSSGSYSKSETSDLSKIWSPAPRHHCQIM